MPCALAPQRARRRAPPADDADRQEQHRLAALLPHEDAQHDATHADDGQHGADDVDPAGPGVGHVADEPDAPNSTIAMITASSRNPTRHER